MTTFSISGNTALKVSLSWNSMKKGVTVLGLITRAQVVRNSQCLEGLTPENSLHLQHLTIISSL